eukprot:4655856-Pleurochrysis_carterae.AAC.2
MSFSTTYLTKQSGEGNSDEAETQENTVGSPCAGAVVVQRVLHRNHEQQRVGSMWCKRLILGTVRAKGKT